MLTLSSILVLEFETRGPGNIKTGGEAIWWGLVTLTTVGYGDEYPVTTLGRLTAVLVMFAGIGIIGALASILASLLVPPPPADEPSPEPEPAAAGTPALDAVTAGAIAEQLAGLRAEIAGQRAEIAALRASLGTGG